MARSNEGYEFRGLLWGLKLYQGLGMNLLYMGVWGLNKLCVLVWDLNLFKGLDSLRGLKLDLNLKLEFCKIHTEKGHIEMAELQQQIIISGTDLLYYRVFSSRIIRHPMEQPQFFY